MIVAHAQTKKIKNTKQLVQELKWKQSDGRTDTTDRITLHANAVGEHSKPSAYRSRCYLVAVR